MQSSVQQSKAKNLSSRGHARGGWVGSPVTGQRSHVWRLRQARGHQAASRGTGKSVKTWRWFPCNNSRRWPPRPLAG